MWLPSVEVKVDHVTNHLFRAHALNSLFTNGAQSLICAAEIVSDSRIRRLQLSRKQLAYGIFLSHKVACFSGALERRYILCTLDSARQNCK